MKISPVNYYCGNTGYLPGLYVRIRESPRHRTPALGIFVDNHLSLLLSSLSYSPVLPKRVSAAAISPIAPRSFVEVDNRFQWP